MKIPNPILEYIERIASGVADTFDEHASTKERERVAIHEAGHVIVAWHCTAVSSVNHIICMASGDGRTYFSVSGMGVSQRHWCQTVIALSGCAAEKQLLGSARSVSSSSDLSNALRSVREMTEKTSNDPPWRISSGSTQNFSFLFREPLAKWEERALREGYRKARQLIAVHEHKIRALANTLIMKRRLSSAQISEVLGNRTFVSIFALSHPYGFYPG